jgi:hypothetical protein
VRVFRELCGHPACHFWQGGQDSGPASKLEGAPEDEKDVAERDTETSMAD